MSLLLKVSPKGFDTMTQGIALMSVRAGNSLPFLADSGHRLAFTLVPLSIRNNEMRAPAPRFRRGGQPMVDTGRLRSSIAYRATIRQLVVGSNVPYANILNKGGVIKPRHGKWLLQPLSPPLSITEARVFPQGKARIKAAFPGSFFLEKGPEGPGIYRPSRRRIGTRVKSGKALYSRSKEKSIERIAAARKSVKIDKREWLVWRPAWLAELSARHERYVAKGTGVQARPSSGGKWFDMGPG